MKIYLATLCISCLSFNALAQDQKAVLQVIEHKGQLLFQDNANEQMNPAVLQQDNVISVSQIGNYNSVTTSVQTQISNLSYNQQGAYNEMDIVATGREVNHNIVQYGDNNSFDNFSVNPASQQSIELIQKGNNQNVSIFGENSMSKNMKVSLEGNDKTLIIRNFN